MQARAQPARVLVVDDSRKYSVQAQQLYDSGQLAAAGEPVTTHSLIDAARSEKPDVAVVILQSEDSFVAVESLMADQPTPILVLHPDGVQLDPFHALSLGALDVA